MQQEPLNRAIHVARWVTLAVVVGIFSGALSAAFNQSINWATDTRLENSWFIWLLPFAGLLVGLSYHYLGRGLERGSNLLIDQIHSHTEWIPLRLTPLIFGASVVSHLAGGSTGREGAALQLAAGVTDPLSKRLGLNPADRSLMLVTAIAGGFGSIFGVPLAGAIFALEVQRVGRIRYEALVPALVASFVGDAVVHALGVHHTILPKMVDVKWSPTIAWQVSLFGLFAGVIAFVFVRVTLFIRGAMTKYVAWYPARPLIGGILLAILIASCGWRDYQGLSIPIMLQAMNGGTSGHFEVKLLLTALTLGTGFVGGEVIPLFVMGALAGATFGSIIGANVALFAIIGSVAVLAGAANTPLACTFIGIELFGGNGAILFAVACVAAYATSGHTGIYHAQKISANKSGEVKT
jgi:H+/Cl- antiporter ClcA